MSSFTGGSLAGGAGGQKLKFKIKPRSGPPAADGSPAAAAGGGGLPPPEPRGPAAAAPAPVIKLRQASSSSRSRPMRSAARGVVRLTHILAGDVAEGVEVGEEVAWEPDPGEEEDAAELAELELAAEAEEDEEDDDFVLAAEEEEEEEGLGGRRRRGKRERGAAGGGRRARAAREAAAAAELPQRELRQRGSRRVVDDYVDPTLLDLDNEEALYGPPEPQAPKVPKEPRPPREPKPKKPPAPKRPPAEEEEEEGYDSGPDAGAALGSSDEEEALDLAMEDDEGDDDFHLEEEEDEPLAKRRKRGLNPPSASAGGELRGRAPRGGRRGGTKQLDLEGEAAEVKPRRGAGSRRGAGGGGSKGLLADFISVDDLDEEELDAWEPQVIGASASGRDFRSLPLKVDATARPLWVCPDGRIFLETYSPIYRQAYDFLIAIAEPVCRPESVHEYVLTPHSLYAAVSVGLETETIISVLNRLSKVELPRELAAYIHANTLNYGKAKLVLKRNKFWVESPHREVLEALLQDDAIQEAREAPGWGADALGLVRSRGVREAAAAELFAATTAAMETGGQPQEGAAAEDQQQQQGLAPAVADGGGGQSQPGVKVKVARGRRVLADDDDDDEEDAPAAPAAAGSSRARQRRGAWSDEEEEDSISESDPEDFSAPAKRLQQRGGRLRQSGAAAAAADGGGGGGVLGGVVGDGGSGAAAVGGGGGVFVGEEEALLDAEVALAAPEREVLAFEVKPEQVEVVKRVCLPPPEGRLNYPLLEEYDFRGDTHNPNLDIELRPGVSLRPYQEKSLAKMFGNGRARSGIIVLPCGAGKSLVGVAAAARIKKGTLVLCTSSVSVDQWAHQFQLWTNLEKHQIARFTAEAKEESITGAANVTITTFTMISHSGKRSEHGEKMMEAIRSREWGLMLLDEVHVVPANMFRKVIGIVKAHTKLGLTATLVREDALIGDLNFLIGPKLYEANWLDLTKAGHIANVQCAEVWCPMTKEFYAEYLRQDHSGLRQLLYVMNPNKFMACQYLIWFHEVVRGDKVIVFSDNVWALQAYAVACRRPFIYGATVHGERTKVLARFKSDSSLNTVFLSKVGDNSLDIPEANVLIQISSHAGSRRQEAQRLGRILRAKRGKPGSGQEGEFNAFFYTLVSRDTKEMFYSAKRQQFLIDQGYAFKVVPNLHEVILNDASWSHSTEVNIDPRAAPPRQDPITSRTLLFADQEAQLNLLSRVLAAKTGLDAMAVEEGRVVDVGEDLVVSQKGGGRGPLGARRVGGSSLALLSGGAGLSYVEYATAGAKVRAAEKAEKTKALRRKLGVA